MRFKFSAWLQSLTGMENMLGNYWEGCARNRVDKLEEKKKNCTQPCGTAGMYILFEYNAP